MKNFILGFVEKCAEYDITDIDDVEFVLKQAGCSAKKKKGKASSHWDKQPMKSIPYKKIGR